MTENRARRTVLAALLASAALLAVPPATGQEGLYGPPVGEDTLLVRVLHASPAGGALEVAVGAARFGPLEYGQVSDYRPVVRDIYRIRAGGREGALEPGEGTYYTVVVDSAAVRVLADETHRDPARAQLCLYNLSSLASVELATTDGRTRVVAAVPPGGSARAAVNAVPARLAVFAAGSLVAEVGDLGLRRGQSYSVFVLGGRPDGGAVRVFAAQALVADG